MRVSLLDNGIGTTIRNKKHWIVAFGRDSTAAIDLLDDAIGRWPSYPTILGLHPMTIIPKSDMSRKQLTSVLSLISERAVALKPAQDIAVIAGTSEEGLAILAELRLMST